MTSRFCLFLIILFPFSWCFSLVKDQDWTWDGNTFDVSYFIYTPPFTSDEPFYIGTPGIETFTFIPPTGTLASMPSYSSVTLSYIPNYPPGLDKEEDHNTNLELFMQNTVTKSERLGDFINKNGYSVKYFTYQQHGLSDTFTTGSIWFKKNNSDGVRDDCLVSFSFYSTEYENLHSETEIKDFTDGFIFKGDNGELLGTNNNAGSGNLSSNNTNVFIPQTLNIDKQWGWMKLPWIYVNAINSWVYYTISGSTSLVYSNKYKTWYKWDASSETWVSVD